MNQSNEPLGRRLRHAAIDRTLVDAERVDDFVLDADGVIDLRELDNDPTGASIADPARALRALRGQLGDAAEVSELYDESELPKPRWRLGLRARHAFGDNVPSAPATPRAATAVADPIVGVALPQLSKVPTSIELAPSVIDLDAIETEAPDTAAFTASESEPTIHIEEVATTADCPKCAALGQRDLLDRFSQIEFFSCGTCMHMWQRNAD